MNASTTQPSVAVRKRNAGKPTLWHRLAPSVLACMATLMALPAQAEVEIPDVPLQSGTAYPAPNIMFILDDSGSMEGGTMPDNVPNTSPDRIENQAYTRNTLYYNPNITYKPWIKADGTRYTGGTDYDAVYSHDSLLSDSQDLSSDTRTFYVPKSGATDFSDSTQYVRYDIKNVSGTMHVIRSELLGGDAWNNVDINNGDWWYKKITVPSGTPELQVKADDSAGDTEGDLYIRSGQKPNSSDYNCRDLDQDHASCTISNPSSGTWWIGVYADGDVDNFDISYTIGSVTYDTPTGRTEAEEITNYAIWYSYHRTRMKSAKAGASEAFNQLGEHYRVGYDSIWNRSRSVTSNDPSAPTGTVAYPIPTGVDDGLFKKPTAADTDTNRTKWFEYLHAADGSSNTPLQAALQRTGEYYESAYPWDSIGDTDISCRQSFAILTTDGYWNYRDGSDYVYIGDIDTTDGSKIDRPLDADGNPTGPSFTYTPANPYQDPDGNARDDTLADVAMHYWNRDLSAMPNNVPESDDDPAFWQHMVTFGVSIGLQGTLDPNIDLPAITNGSKEWPNPNDTEDLDRIDDLWHASVNGHGKFVAATRPDEFVRGLLDALLSVAERVGSASNVTANSTSLQANTRLYQASYVSGRWTGELQAFDVSDAGISSVPEWQASQLIPAAADRSIWTMSGTTGADFVTTVQGNGVLARTTGLAQVTSADNAAYLAGDQSNELLNGGVLRDRSTVLGDIANSSPYFVDGTKTIFVGANDGMLHAFAAVARGTGSNAIAAGEEVFAYVPAGIDLAALATLSDPQYSGGHKYFVDGPLVVSTTTQTPGKNYLVGSLGRGGKGVFGLDVTSPDSFGASNVLWDKTFKVGGTAPAGYDNMGQVLGDPLVVPLNNGDMGVIVGNGINSGNGGTTATASLFIIDIETGTVIKELNTGAVGDNGLSAPRGADLNGDRIVDIVYAGDLQGNVWKFDLSDADETNWAIANSGAAMFVAKDASGNRQPITTGLALATDPSTSKTWVFVGTGSFLTLDDVSNNDVQSMYGLIDDNAVITRAELDEQDIAGTTVVNGRNLRYFEKHQPSLDGTKKGWFIDLDTPSPGERIVSNPRVDGGVLVTTSIIPPTDNTCEAGGTGYINSVSAFTGTATEFPYFDANGDGTIDQDDTVTVTNPDGSTTQVPVGSLGTDAMPSLAIRIGNRLYYGKSDGGSDDEKFNPQGALARRTSWREIRGD